MISPKKVLIIIPAFNEERTIRRLVQEIKKIYPDFTVLVINDGSTDHTAEEALEVGAFLIDLPYNLGIGGAIQTGFKVAFEENFDIAVQIDGDGQHDPRYLPCILEPVASGKVDLCIGSRFLNEHSGFKSTFSRRIGIRFFSSLLGLLTGVPITDPTSGFRAYGKKIIPIFAQFYPVDFPEPEAVMTAKRYNAKISEVPVNMRKRLGGISSIRYLKTIYYMLKVTMAILIDMLKKKQKEISYGS